MSQSVRYQTLENITYQIAKIITINITTAPRHAAISIQPEYPLSVSSVCGLVDGDVDGLYRTSAPRMIAPIEAPSSDLCSKMIVSNVLLGKTETLAKNNASGCCT